MTQDRVSEELAEAERLFNEPIRERLIAIGRADGLLYAAGIVQALGERNPHMSADWLAGVLDAESAIRSLDLASGLNDPKSERPLWPHQCE